MRPTIKNDAAACEVYCSTVRTRGSVAWTFYTDITSGNNCECFAEFTTPTNGRVKANAISGRFVPEGDPNETNCRDKCAFGSFSGDISTGISLEDCVATCSNGSYSGYGYASFLNSCFCYGSRYGSPSWRAYFKTVIFADTA